MGILQAWNQKLSQAETEEFLRLASLTESSSVNVVSLAEAMLA